MIEGQRVGSDIVELTLLQYVDDTLIFLPQNIKDHKHQKTPTLFFSYVRLRY